MVVCGGLACVLNTRHTAVTADGIPLSSYAPAAADAVVTLFALSGLAFVLMGLTAGVVLLRYRALLPLTYLLLLADTLGRRWIVAAHPIARGGATDIGGFSLGALVNWSIIAMIVLGLAFSLLRRKDAP